MPWLIQVFYQFFSYLGYSLREPAAFSKRFYRLFNGALGLPKDAPVEEIEVDLEESEDEKGNIILILL